MQNLHLLDNSAEVFRCHAHHYQFGGHGRTGCDGAHGTEKLLLNTQVSEDFA